MIKCLADLEAPRPTIVKPYNLKSMSLVSLELFKKHVRADDFNTDDEQLQQYLDAAEQQVIMATNRTENELVEMGGGEFPPYARTSRVAGCGGVVCHARKHGRSAVSRSAIRCYGID